MNTAAETPGTASPLGLGLGLGLGMDAGGTQTRWALAGTGGALRAEGVAAGLTGLQLGSAEGRADMAATLAAVALAAGPAQHVVAGLTGFDSAQAPQLGRLVAAAWGIAPQAVRLMNDIELACHAAPPGAVVVCAGTGSIAAWLDAAGTLHRAGGRGALIDDAGGGHWIAREALRHVWRAEDEAPGAWRESALAQQVFAHIGGSDWAQTRQWVYGASRGALGTLARAVAAAAAADPAARVILDNAGAELARLAQALLRRHGARPLVLAGRVFDLHPAIEQALRAALPAGASVQRLAVPAHHAAARLAVNESPP